MTIEQEIGIRIRDLRNRNGLTQEELADRTELTKGFISQLERGLTAPSMSTLKDIVECLGTNLSEFFAEDNDLQIVYRKEDYYTKEDDNGNTTEWLVASAQSRSVEPILVRLKPGTSTTLDKPHEGEEFGYVIKGAVKVNYGDDEYVVNKGDSFIYPAKRKHSISCTGSKEAVFIWVSSPPSF
ncbi:transcriptional regulator, XRE family with cupin sensor [Ruminococcaceae bacterium YRB3002]|nr:transcriptional regulator, XRE family with cupin sensor [Ruminococcaceae bacterium YRB3002]